MTPLPHPASVSLSLSLAHSEFIQWLPFALLCNTKKKKQEGGERNVAWFNFCYQGGDIYTEEIRNDTREDRIKG